jgi:hypothetical protein
VQGTPERPQGLGDEDSLEVHPPHDGSVALRMTAVVGEGGTSLQAGRDIHQHWNRLVQSLEVDDEDVRWAVGTFAAPPGFDHLRAILDQYRIAVIADRVGTGRRTAGLNLLDTDQDDGVRELDPDWGVPRTDALPSEHGARYLLDLTHESADPPEQFGRDLKNHARRLMAAQARLVITVTPEGWRMCTSETSAFTGRVGLPDVDAVLRAHLGYRDPDGIRSRAWEHPSLVQLLEELRSKSTPPRDVVRLVEIVLGSPDLDMDRLCNEFLRWESYLDGQFADASAQPPGAQSAVAQQRALLIASAVLDGLPAAAVYECSNALLEQLRTAPPRTEMLAGPELSALISKIEAVHDGDAISITAKHHGVDGAILDRVWLQRPQLRQHLLSWMATITSDRGPAARHVDRVGDVLTRLTVQQQSLEALTIVQGWLVRGGNRRLAIRILEDLSISPDIGSPVRRRLYEWAKSMEPAVLTGVAEVCAGKLGERYPRAALTRLRLIGLRGDSQEIRDAVGLALRALAARDQLQREVTDQVMAWLVDAGSRRVGSIGFISLVDPDAVEGVGRQLISAAATNPALRSALSESWSAVLADEVIGPAANDVARRWLQRADEGVLDTTTVTHILGPVVLRNLSSGAGQFILLGSDDPSPAREAILTFLARTPPTSMPSAPAPRVST